MTLFGGIYEITKELNDFHLYDFKRNKWITLFEETYSPKKGGPNDYFMDASSPISGAALSPKRSSPKRNSSLKRGSSPLNRSANRNSPKKNLNITIKEGNTRNNNGPFSDCKLTTPTSISMLNSFLIKNADKNFDHYYNQMRKRKNQMNNISNTTGMGEKIDYGKIQGKKPAARDGHTGLMYGDLFICFGGDRHHMPFNDTFILDLGRETTG